MSAELTASQWERLALSTSMAHDTQRARAEAAEQTLAAVIAATDDAARHLGHAHPVVLALREALGAS